MSNFDDLKNIVRDYEPAPIPDDFMRTRTYEPRPTKVVPWQEERSVSIWPLVLIVALVVGSVVFFSVRASSAPAMPASVSQVLETGASGEDVKELQAALTAAGWPTWVDGIYGPHTTRTVLLYQKANGLLVDGIAGPQTLGHLGIWGTDTPTLAPVPSPVPSLAVGACSQWTATAVAVGWPVERLEWLSGIMHRESRCQPGAYNGRGNDQSYGLLQINTKGALWGELQRRCGLTDKGQLHDATTNLACGYKLYLVYGTRPWRTG